MGDYRLAMFATAVWESPVASPTALSDSPAATAARIRLSRLSVHSLTFCAALAAGARSVIGGLGGAGRGAGADVDEASEPVLGHSVLDGLVAVLALGDFFVRHAVTVNNGSNLVNKVAA